MGHSYGVGGGISSSFWRPHGRHPREQRCAKCSYVHAQFFDGAYTTLKDKKTKVVNVLCLYFVYKVEFLKMQNHPISQMDKLFQVPKGLGANKSLYNEAKYANYPADELRMMKMLTKKGDCIFNIFRGLKPIYATMVSDIIYHVRSLESINPN